ncbi:MAG: PAS domain S-box protein [Methylocella sp.]
MPFLISPTRLTLLGAMMIAGAIFAADLFGPLQGATAVLYIIAILLASQTSGRRSVLLAGLGCAVLAMIGFAVNYRGDPIDGAFLRFVVSLIVIAASTILSMRERTVRTTLAERAHIVELTHDTVIIRDAKDVIDYWNDGAERLYGWTREEAIGKACQQLLHSEFPSAEVARALRENGRWSGELTRVSRDGSRIVLASRWLRRRNPEGEAIGVMEASADVTEQRRADADREVLERRYSAVFHAAGFATWESDWSALWRIVKAVTANGAGLHAWLAAQPEAVRAAAGQAAIRDVNHAAVKLFGGTSREALVGGNIVGRYLPESEQSFARMLGSLFEGAEVVETEARFSTLNGGTVDVLLWVTPLREGKPWSRVLVMAHDITERNEARAKLEQTSAQLAHATRVSLLGQLAASIAHEVNEPLAAIINYGNAGKRWLLREAPNTPEVAKCLDHIIFNGSRAAEVLARVRSLARKEAPQLRPLDLAELIDEAVSLVQREASAARVIIRRVVAANLPLICGDRVQIQQVIVNLLINAIQAMQNISGRPREIRVGVNSQADNMVHIAVRDSGTGISGNPTDIFTPFFTTKADGMGMGLSICRSIIEAQGGHITAINNPDFGATVTFTLPINPAGQTRRLDNSQT